MRKMGIDAEMYLSEAVELFPQSLMMFKEIGLCCVNEENESWTVRELCENYGLEAEAFVEAVNELL